MIRISQLFQRWESHISISYSHLKLIRFSMAVLVCAHWLACGFYLVVVIEDSDVSSLLSSLTSSCVLQDSAIIVKLQSM